MEIMQVARKGRHVNNVEKYMFCTHKQNKQMNNVPFDHKNPKIETVLTITPHKNGTSATTLQIASGTIPLHPTQGKSSHQQRQSYMSTNPLYDTIAQNKVRESTSQLLTLP
jgi:hypothetical protein